MFITVFSLLVALIIQFYPPLQATPLNTNFISLAMLIAGTSMLIVFPLLNSLFFIPMQSLESHLVPRLFANFRKDKIWRLFRFFIYFFAFLSYVFAILLVSFEASHQHLLLAIWVFAFGITLDLIRDELQRVSKFLNPFYAVENLHQEAINAIRNEKEPVLLSTVESLAEVALRAVETSKIALCTQVVNTFPPILHSFFESSKSITHKSEDKAIEKTTGGFDEASYTVFYMLQRLELINGRALELHVSSINSHLITVLGKIVIECAYLDLSLVSFPVHVLGKFALKAQQYHYDEAAALATSTLLEIAKTIINDVDLKYVELVNPFTTIIDNMDAIAQATFKKDKNINIRLIIQPLRDLKTLFENEKMASHRDTPIIIQYVDSKIAAFEALEQVMRSIPPIPNMDQP